MASRFNAYEFEKASGDGEGQGSLECCSPWGHKESDRTEWLNWTETFSICEQTMWLIYMSNPTSCFGGESQGTHVLCICALRQLKTLTSQLEAESNTFVRGNPCLMPLSSLLWLFLAFTFSGRDALKHRCECSGWKDFTQACGDSTGLGEERRIGEKQASYDFSLFRGVVVLNESNSYIILFTVSPLFSDFPHRIQGSPECYSTPARHIQSSWGVSYPELSVWNKSDVWNSLEQLQHFLVQATSQWRDDFPYKEWPLLYKYWEIT